MAINVPGEYIVSTGGQDFRAEYVGTGERFMPLVDLEEADWRFTVPEGTLFVNTEHEGGLCVLVTASSDNPEELLQLDPTNYHLYRLTGLGQLDSPEQAHSG